MFEKASRDKYRFRTTKGIILTEDLWDLPLIHKVHSSLDDVARTLNKALKESEEESFVEKKSSINEILELKLSIVKYIIKVKLEEKEQAENVVLVKAKKEKILNILADKEDDTLKGKSAEDLKKMLNEL